jgi:predicted nucleotidyltransferase
MSALPAIVTALRGALVRSHDIEPALLFGSFARGQERPDSDVDVAVLAPHLDFLALAADLADAVKREVDVVDISRAGYPLTRKPCCAIPSSCTKADMEPRRVGEPVRSLRPRPTAPGSNVCAMLTSSASRRATRFSKRLSPRSSGSLKTGLRASRHDLTPRFTADAAKDSVRDRD